MSDIDIKKLANLAKINLTEKDLKTYSQQITAILDYISKVQEVNTKKIKETIQLSYAKDKFRKDKTVLPKKEDIKSLTKSENFFESYFTSKKVL